MKFCAFIKDIGLHYIDEIERYSHLVIDEPQDPEHLHQLRVYTRRCRSILKTLQRYFDQNYIESAQKQLEEITQRTNRARDLDVMIDLLQEHPIPSVMKPYLDHIVDILHKIRDEEYEKLTPFLRQIPSYLSEMKNIACKSDKEALRAIKSAIKKRKRKIEKMLFSNTQTDLHKLRIECKKLRYLYELYVLVNPKKKSSLKRLKKIQDFLGIIHDREIQCTHLRDLAARDLDIDALLALGKVIGDLEQEKEEYQARLNLKTIKDLLEDV
ncbi:CHAD domain-containing protein [Nitratiruptor sp. SB155-2]|uniref:CHAD domain-containing protein n=1 Tax=Nitratiruptor sp. (strain SB155-2) TaxID=387092 RepID=UPI0001586D1A|nr:CHAD domain-containing protein [Nitratiruptor sp. SB155-2]BAF69319.1 conserved hypothetical protein [Nitratiruptor sp. SB155-2]